MLMAAVMGLVLRLKQAQVSGSVYVSKVVMPELAIRACLMPSEQMTVISAGVVPCVILIAIVSAVFVWPHVRQIVHMEVYVVPDPRRVLRVVA